MRSDHIGQWSFPPVCTAGDESNIPRLGGGQYGVASNERHNQEGHKDNRQIVHLQSLSYTRAFPVL